MSLGVVLKGFDLRTRLFETGKFYGWMCTGAKKIFPSHENNCVPQVKEYGGCAKIGDVIGVYIEFINGSGRLSFLKNGNPLGVCIDYLPPGNYLPCVSLFRSEVKITLNTSVSVHEPTRK